MGIQQPKDNAQIQQWQSLDFIEQQNTQSQGSAGQTSDRKQSDYITVIYFCAAAASAP